MALFSQGREMMPAAGIAFIQYNKVMKPGTSIVNHPILPGILNRLVLDVLPIPYITSLNLLEY